MPWTMATFVIAGLSLIGTPLAVGFISKFQLVTAAIEIDLWYVGLWVLITSLLAVVYVWRVVEVAYFRPPADGATSMKEAPFSMLLPTVALGVAIVWFGIDGETTLVIAKTAAEALIEGY